MNQIISNFLKALSMVEKRHYSVPRVELIDDQINVYGDQFITYENNLVTQLNEKYAIISYIGKIDDPSESTRQFQIPKRYLYAEHNAPLIKISFDKIMQRVGDSTNVIEELMTIPDFIIHRSQDYKEQENQHFIAEVKSEKALSYSRFVWDFFKLNLYLEKFNFQVVCFLIINNDSTRVSQFIGRYLSEKFYVTDRKKDLYIIIKENYDSEPIVKTVAELIKIL